MSVLQLQNAWAVSRTGGGPFNIPPVGGGVGRDILVVALVPPLRSSSPHRCARLMVLSSGFDCLVAALVSSFVSGFVSPCVRLVAALVSCSSSGFDHIIATLVLFASSLARPVRIIASSSCRPVRLVATHVSPLPRRYPRLAFASNAVASRWRPLRDGVSFAMVVLERCLLGDGVRFVDGDRGGGWMAARPWLPFLEVVSPRGPGI